MVVADLAQCHSNKTRPVDTGLGTLLAIFVLPMNPFYTSFSLVLQQNTCGAWWGWLWESKFDLGPLHNCFGGCQNTPLPAAMSRLLDWQRFDGPFGKRVIEHALTKNSLKILLS
jgi:hypothetical protein